jgi:hypothetical protein
LSVSLRNVGKQLLIVCGHSGSVAGADEHRGNFTGIAVDLKMLYKQIILIEADTLLVRYFNSVLFNKYNNMANTPTILSTSLQPNSSIQTTPLLISHIATFT